jgi:hypothetical protein
MLCVSSSSTEVGVIYCDDDGVTWRQLDLDEIQRAEMCLSHDSNETWPISVAIDFTSTRDIIDGGG